jgi:hypothetical protein
VVSHVRRQELERGRSEGGRVLHTIMSVERAVWAMQEPSLVEWMAWRRYLIATRASSSAAYALIEEAAWTRLLDDLGQVEFQPSALRFAHGRSSSETPVNADASRSSRQRS